MGTTNTNYWGPRHFSGSQTIRSILRKQFEKFTPLKFYFSPKIHFNKYHLCQNTSWDILNSIMEEMIMYFQNNQCVAQVKVIGEY